MSSIVLLLALTAIFRDVTSAPWDKQIFAAKHFLAGKGNMYKIMNGKPAKPGAYPFAVSLQLFGDHFCGGSVISENWVVSAAHCFPYPFFTPLIQIQAGTTDLASGGGTLHDVEELILHSEYNQPTLFNNDIALIKVEKPFQLGDAVQKVLIADYNYILDQGTEVISAGWGLTEKGEEAGTSPILLETSLKVVDRKKCSNSPGMRRLHELEASLVITNGMVCACSNGTDTKQGDSGGPLVTRVDGNLVLVGIVSWGEGTGETSSPGVYTNVAKYTKWIYKKLHNPESEKPEGDELPE